MLLQRHASAGEPLDSPSLDRARPLDRIGRGDARRLAEVLAGYPIQRIVTSSHGRCKETVRPLAEARGLAIEWREELAPDAPLEDTNALLDELPDDALVCTHREVIERLFDGTVACEKGGTWVVERRGSRFVPTEYLPPPDDARAEAPVGRPRRKALGGDGFRACEGERRALA
jgi:phosphohistidine phosphatase SixA